MWNLKEIRRNECVLQTNFTKEIYTMSVNFYQIPRILRFPFKCPWKYAPKFPHKIHCKISEKCRECPSSERDRAKQRLDLCSPSSADFGWAGTGKRSVRTRPWPRASGLGHVSHAPSRKGMARRDLGRLVQVAILAIARAAVRVLACGKRTKTGHILLHVGVDSLKVLTPVLCSGCCRVLCSDRY